MSTEHCAHCAIRGAEEFKSLRSDNERLKRERTKTREALASVFHDLSSTIGLLSVSVLKGEPGTLRRLQSAMERFDAALALVGED